MTHDITSRLLRYSIVFFLLAFILSCKKETVARFDEENSIFMTIPEEYQLGGGGTAHIDFNMGYNDAQDELVLRAGYNFSLLTQGVDRTRDTLKIAIRMLGFLSNQDREVDVRIKPDSTNAVDGVDFQLLPTKMSANVEWDTIRVVLLRTEKLRQNPIRIALELHTNEHFPQLINISGPLGGPLVPLKSIIIEVNDFLTKPDNWDEYNLYGTILPYGLILQFGPYSQEKHRMVIQTFGTSNIMSPTLFGFPRDTNFGSGHFRLIDWLINMQRLQTILTEYEQEHGEPLRDENGVIISFPTFEYTG